MMHAILTTAVIALLSSPALSISQDATPNFSGTWTMDAAKTDWGPMPAPQSMTAVIEHKEPVIKVTATQKSAEGEQTSVRNLTTDGQENRNTIKTMEGDQPIKSASKWNGKALATTSSLTVQNMAVTVTETWELSADGKTLTTTREISTDQGSFPQKVVFTKQ